MNKHTPGPWEEMGGLITAERRDARGFFCKPISICRPMRNLKSSSANARLIAAAPDLLEALKNMVSLVELMCPFDGPQQRQARAAIARATGEQP